MTTVYIDGENIVHQLVDVLQVAKPTATRQDILNVDIRRTLQHILNDKDLDIRYYATSLRLVRTDPILEKRSREMMRWSEQWANVLTAQKIAIIKAGKLKVRDGELCPRCGYQEATFREKGVDVRLAIDIVVDSTQQKKMVLWSSDSDLLPAIQVAKRSGVSVKNTASQSGLNWGVARQCGQWQTYDAKDIKKVLRAKK